MFSLPMCIAPADSIKNLLKRPAVAPPSQVWSLHTSARLQTSEVAARPLQCQPALMAAPFTHKGSVTFDREGDLTPASAQVPNSVSCWKWDVEDHVVSSWEYARRGSESFPDVSWRSSADEQHCKPRWVTCSAVRNLRTNPASLFSDYCSSNVRN